MKRITLCADDFAQSLPISEGILELVAANRLGAVSCMTDSPFWPEMAERLNAMNTSVQAGLHFNLTHDFAGSHLSVLELMKDSLTSNLNIPVIRSSFIRQWDTFEKHYGQPPEFVDGHQHVHAFPGIRDVVLEETVKRNPHAWVRLPITSDLSIKGLVLRGITCGFERAVHRAGLAFNPHFSGFRPYKGGFDFGRFFRKILASGEDETLVMCHPGLAADDSTDPISSFRQAELDYLKSPDFLTDVIQNGVTLRTSRDDKPFLHTGSLHCPSPA